MQGKRKKDQTQEFFNSKRLTYAAVAIITVLVLAGFFIYLYPHQPGQAKAAIIDQLSSSQLTSLSRYPNQTFVETSKELLAQRFPEVDYYSDNATVDNYRILASLGYKLIIWRAHSAVDPSGYVAISSSEAYVQGKYEQYSEEQLKLCNITGDPVLYFAITPDFIKDRMDGRFEDTVIVLMSCNGLNQSCLKTAEALKDKGAKAIISWNGWIDESYNDNAITLLLQHLINENNTIAEAVGKIPQSPPSSPYGPPSKLNYYPPEIADYRIPNYKQSSITSSAGFAAVTISKKIKIEA
jgi:hypothetical protein